MLKEPGEFPTERGERVKDLVCQIDLSKDGALTQTHEDKTYYFCSDACRDRFQTNPEKSLKGKP